MPFEGFDFTDFWEEEDYALEYLSEPPSDQLIAEIEAELGYKLPESYIWLMKQHNGGMPVNTCFPTNEPTSWAEDHVAVTGILGIGRERSYSLCGDLGSTFMIEEWGYPNIGVAIGDCPSAGHDMIFLDYRECGPQGEPQVVHVDQEDDYRSTFLAKNFEEFIRGLVHEEVFEDAEAEKEADLEMARTAPFGDVLTVLCSKSDKAAENELWIRHIAVEIIEEKGFFALHADPQSMLLYDIQFWLYTQTYPDVTEEQYLEYYSGIIALASSFTTNGYAPAFITDWLAQAKEDGRIAVRDGFISFTQEAEAELLGKRDAFEKEYIQ